MRNKCIINAQMLIREEDAQSCVMYLLTPSWAMGGRQRQWCPCCDHARHQVCLGPESRSAIQYVLEAHGNTILAPPVLRVAARLSRGAEAKHLNLPLYHTNRFGLSFVIKTTVPTCLVMFVNMLLSTRLVHVKGRGSRSCNEHDLTWH
jgi:hypothetical protein